MTKITLDAVLGDLLGNDSFTWLITGAAGFIGSHLTEQLLKHGQTVVGFDNYATGNRWNLEDIRIKVGEAAWQRFSFIEGDIRKQEDCVRAVKGVDYILHQAALGSVPKSIENPTEWNAVNVQGTVEMFSAAKKEPSVKGFVYASSSSVYGDSPILPKQEEIIGRALSPYAVSKYTDELYAKVFYSCYNFPSVGLRYFNVFGPRQDPNGAYAAVMPKWIQQMLKNEQCVINGDGSTSRDFCYVENVVQANIRSALSCKNLSEAVVFNVGVGEQTNLKQLHQLLATEVEKATGSVVAAPHFASFRAGDIQHSLADVSKIKNLIGFVPTHTIAEGIIISVPSYVEKFRSPT